MTFVRTLVRTLALVATAAPLLSQQPQRRSASSAPAADSLSAAADSRDARGLPVGGDAPAGARGAASAAASQAHEVDIITPHITDAHHIEYPCFHAALVCERELPRFQPLHAGPVALDLSPTKHVVMLLIAAILTAALLLGGATASRKHHVAAGRPRGFASGIEAVVLYVRNEVVLPNVGAHGNAFVPFVLTLFFFILFANLLGLIPYGSTATGNISVTATLAIITFFVVEIAGMRALGAGYLNTIFYWNKELNPILRVLMFLIMSPVEILGKFTKPFALTIRLFANMTAGHIVVLAFIGLFFGFAGPRLHLSSVVGIAPLLMAVAIMLLELFVAFLQAFIFSLLASVFIGQIREAHH